MRRLFIRVVACMVAFYLIYIYMLLGSDDLFKQIPVEHYQLNDANSFETKAFYVQSSYKRKTHDVTIVTQVSVDRLFRVTDMAESWEGPISAAVYVKNAEEELPQIDELAEKNTAVRKFVDFHVMYANKTRYPVNNLRNLALINSRTSLVFILDADFVTSNNMHHYLSAAGEEYLMDKTHSNYALVVAAFSSSMKPSKLPKTKAKLIDATESNTVIPVNKDPCPKCHGPTDYQKWYTESEVYEVIYQWIYEPYLLLNKEYLTEFFDERLKGYGFDKNSHAFTLAAAGYRFFVLPDPFVIHLSHESADWDGGNLLEQQFEALKIVCDIIPKAKQKYNHNPDIALFGEPVGPTCMTREHW